MPKFSLAKVLPMAIVMIAIVGAILWYLWPTGHAPAKAYFAPIGERVLQKDEIGQFNYIYEQYEHMSFTGDEFKGWDIDAQSLWRYGIAFGAYSIAIDRYDQSCT